MVADYRILIVEDTEENIIFMSQILDDHGYTYAVARNGQEGIKVLETDTPELVLLDIMMPRKTGFGVYKKMKSEPRLEKVPIIVVTGASEVTGVDMRTGEEEPKDGYGDDLSRRIGSALAAQMSKIEPDAYVEKPIDPALLVAKIKECLP